MKTISTKAESIRSSSIKFKSLWLYGIIISIGLPVLVLWIFFRADTGPPPPPDSEVILADIVQTVQAAGVLQAKVKVDVGAQVSGLIRRIHVHLGQQVKKGDLLVSLDPELALNDVEQAAASLAQQMALIDSRQADLQLAVAEVNRQRRLFSRQATAATEVDRAEVELTKLNADLRGQRANLKRMTAELEKRRLALSYTAIRAPMDGLVVSLAVQEGQSVNAVQMTPVMLTLANMDEITVHTRVPEADIGLVKVGQNARFITLANDSQSHQGIVKIIQPIPERLGNAVFYNVLFYVHNKARSLLTGMTVQVIIDTGRASGVLSIPVVALGTRSEDGSFTVMVSSTRGSVQPRKVRIGLQDGARAQILDGLEAGERVLMAPMPEVAGVSQSKAN